MPREVRDPYSKAKLFIPTHQEKSIKEMENQLKEKLEYADNLINRLEQSVKEKGL